MIAHRLFMIRNADLTLVMKDGDIIESGNHESLIQKAGLVLEKIFNEKNILTRYY